ncbi:MAG: 50S ribosomal protein L22, partial [Proteobacteria bacterium]
ANATQKQTLDVDKLYVKTLLVGAGPTLKRFMPRAKGSASPIMKRTSHITVTLAERKAGK